MFPPAMSSFSDGAVVPMPILPLLFKATKTVSATTSESVTLILPASFALVTAPVAMLSLEIAAVKFAGARLLAEIPVNPDPLPLNDVAVTVPATSNFAPGVVVPMPTLPELNNVMMVLLVGSNAACANEISRRVLELVPLFSYRDKLNAAAAPNASDAFPWRASIKVVFGSFNVDVAVCD